MSIRTAREQRNLSGKTHHAACDIFNLSVVNCVEPENDERRLLPRVLRIELIFPS
jgi:hypothetical protein